MNEYPFEVLQNRINLITLQPLPNKILYSANYE
jgi:hypothetical protein